MGSNQLAPPPGFELSTPPPPEGFDLAQPMSMAPPPPEGFDNPTSPLSPDKAPVPEKTNLEVPGFWSTVGSSFGRGVAERAAADLAGAQIALPRGLGGKSLEEQYQEGLVHPETKDEIDNLLGQKVTQGWNDPKWWGAQIAHGTGSVIPGAGAAAVGSLARIPAPITFGAEAGLGSLVPAYKAARAAGLEPEDAAHRAIVDSGISTAAAVAMGLAPSVSLFGKTTNPAITDQVATMLKRPVMEMLAQLGLVQPGLAISGHLVTSLSHGEVPDAADLATTGVVGVGMGGAMVGAHAAIRGANAARKAAIPIEPPAGPEAIQAGFVAQGGVPPPPEGYSEFAPGTVPPVVPESAGKPVVIRPNEPPVVPPPEGIVPPPSANSPILPQAEETLYPRENRAFFSPTRRAVEEKLPDNASVDQTMATLRNAPGVKQEELDDLRLPAYLAGLDGRVNKKDLIAHLEANSVVLEEVRAGDPLYSSKNELEPQFSTSIAPGEHSNYREFILKTPVKEDISPANLEARARDMWDYNYSREFGPWEMAGEDSRQVMIQKAREFSRDENPNIYTGSHWKEPNAIGHIRTTDRQGRNGENLLHVEEMQSDLHQAGRKQGYRAPNLPNADLAGLERAVERASTQYQKARRVEEQRGLDHGAETLRLRQDWRAAIDEYQRGLNNNLENQGKAPDLPFKTSWPELMVKRVLQVAADEGYDGVSWANGDQVGLRLSGSNQIRGNRKFYDETLPSLFKKWARKLGMDTGTTRFDLGENLYAKFPLHVQEKLRELHVERGLDPRRENGFVEVSPAAGNLIRQGLPLYETDPKGKTTLSDTVRKGLPKELAEPGKKLVQALGQLGREIKLSRGIEFIVEPDRRGWRGRVDGQLNSRGEYVMRINTRLLSRPEDVYATMGHELGHIIYRDKWALAPDATKLQIHETFRQFRDSMTADAKTVGDVRRMRDNAVSEMTGARNEQIRGKGGQFGSRLNDLPLSDLQPRSRSYLLHFDEWFAEQVAKWATTSEKPLSRVEKFFKEVGKVVRDLVEKFQQLSGRSAKAVPAMQEWLDSLVPDSTFMADVKDKLEFDTKRRNQDAMDKDGTPEVPASSATASTVGGRNILDSLPPGSVGGSGPAMAAHADRMNRFYEWMTSLPQIASQNKHIRGLTQYKEIVSTMNVEKNEIMGRAWETLRQWRGIRDPKQQFGLNKFIEDYMNGLFKDPSDVSGEIRRPTAAEFSALVAKHKLSDNSVKMFGKLTRDFDGFLEQYRTLLLSDAIRIKDPDRQKQAISDINKRVDTLLQRPYFPAMRFGKYTITVYDSVGNVRHFEQTESLRKQTRIKEALEKSSDLLPGDRVRTGEVAKDAAPLLGMPPGLLDLMAEKLDLSSTQKAMLDQLRFDYAPSQSFRHQFKTKDLTPGYSQDFQRAYANFFFHGANHMTRVKWVDALRDRIREVKSDSILLDNANKRDQIANYMTEHLKMLVDPKPDFAALRGLMFHWFLGFNPASATLNLSQTPIMTFPHLASKFGGLGIGDARAIGALAKASAELNNFYKKGTLVDLAKTAPPGPQGSKLRALAEAVNEGVISETQAHTLAAVSENRNLLRAFGTKGEERWQQFSEASSWMFEMTEQYNRRVAFRAAWDLAMRDANNAYVKQTVRDNPLQYKRLLDKGWSHQEAAAFTAAKDSVEATQFVYAPYARPKFMWGRKGALFIFKSFTQNTLFNFYNNPAGAARSLLILGAVGGAMGLPGMEDVNGILKSLAWRLFGKDFDLEDEGRKFAVDVLNGTISPDILLHGTSVKGFGIPHVMNGIGAQAGLPKWFPTLDRHGSIGMGNILPFEPGKLFGPTKDVKGNELAQIQRASGAGFSNIFAMYNFLTSQQSLSDLKRWEGIMPRAASNVSHAFRYFTEGVERNKAGNSVVRFDPSDTEQMAEILARAAGYQPRRLIGAYEAIQAKQEAATYWDLRKGLLLRQFGAAIKGGDPAEKASVVQAVKNYNQDLPQEAKGKAITSQVLKDSVMQRLRVQQKQEAGLPTSKQNYPIFKSMDKYFPDGRPTGQVDARPVK